MTSPTTKAMDRLDDGYIKGQIYHLRQECDHCHKRTMCIKVEKVTLPPSIKPSTHLITFHYQRTTQLTHVECLGISCGCYAKAHRQLVHITGGK